MLVPEIRALMVSQAQAARLLPTGWAGKQGEGVPVLKHTLGTKANWCMLAMGRHSLETRTISEELGYKTALQ